MPEVTLRASGKYMVSAERRTRDCNSNEQAVTVALAAALPAIVVRALLRYRPELTTDAVVVEFVNVGHPLNSNMPPLWIQVAPDWAPDLSEARTAIRAALRNAIKAFLRDQGVPLTELAFDVTLNFIDGCGCSVQPGKPDTEWP